MADSFYLADSTEVHRIRLSDERLAAAGTPPAGPATSSIRVKVSKSNKAFGIRPRGVRLKKTETAGTVSNTSYSFLPVLTPTAYASAAFAEGATVTIDGEAWEVTAKVPEDF